MTAQIVLSFLLPAGSAPRARRLSGAVFFGVLASGLLQAAPAQARDLLETFELAKTNDPTFQAATHEQLAEESSLRIAWSNLLPTITGEASYAKDKQQVQSSDNDVFAVGSTTYPIKTYGASLTQPIFRMTEWAEVSQARATVKESAARLDAAYQDLIFRSAKAYLGVLEMKALLDLRRAERASLQEQAEHQQRRLDSGLGTAPDVYEAEARAALASADEEYAEADLEDAIQALAEITGEIDTSPRPLAENIPLALPEPANPDRWVQQAIARNPDLEAQRQAVVASEREIDRQRSAHLPTVDFTASINNRDTDGSLFGGGSQVETKEYGINVNIPFFAGGSAIFSTQRATDLKRRNEQRLVQERREVERLTRNAFQVVGSAARRLGALSRSVEVQAEAVAAREKSVDAGVDTVMNVLNAKREFYEGMRDYTSARYTYVIAVLALERNVGVLGVEDLERVSEWLKPED